MNDHDIDLVMTNFRSIMANHMPEGFGYQNVWQGKVLGGAKVYISFAPSYQVIGKIQGQYPHRVSLWFDPVTLEFDTVNIGGMGERSLKLTTTTNFVTDTYAVAFRKPKKAMLNIYNAFDKFCERYVEGLKFFLPTLAYKNMLSPVANKVLGLPLYTIEKDLDIAVIKSSDNNMLTFVAIALNLPQETKYILRITTKDLDKAKQFVELWYETEAEAAKRRVNA